MSITETTIPQITLNGVSREFAAFSELDARARLLIVDDSAVVRRAFSRGLSAFYDCDEASDAQEAMDLLRETNYDLVITDIIMPGLSGVELLRKIVSEYPETAVLVVSGVDRPQRALDAIRLGAFDYLIKPCEPEVLQITVERALERSSLIRNAKKYKQDLEARNEELVRGKKQLERLQAQIIHSEKMASLGQLAAGIAHELNNPVGFVFGNLELLERAIADLMKLIEFYESLYLDDATARIAAELKDSICYDQTIEDLTSIITDCQDGTVRIRDIVQNLRTFSRLDEAEFKGTDIHEGIDSTIRLLSRYFSGGNIRLMREFGEVPTIEAYSAQLNQVWTNLLVNAAQAVGDKGGVVTIRTRREADSVIVEVSDSGDGIAPEIINRIFDPFFTTKPVGEGTGLGLTITFGIVERHGGKITVDSRPGEGSTFSVELPLNVRPADRATEA
ncbi:MAG TPA: response regulator [Pyrinomonadaceae bacterium]|nr:response regulator [Pyrinomonadaceae bacterium]HMP65271.1 response regulator [Pyrinomonadaceae bacterium]